MRSVSRIPSAMALAVAGLLSGAFPAAGQSPPSFAAATYPSGTTGMYLLVSNDFNGDGVLDFAGAHISATPAPLWIVVSNGLTYAPVALPPSISFSTQNVIVGAVFEMVAADLNSDGITDLAASNLLESVQIFRGNGTGNFTDLGLYSFANPAIGVHSPVITALRAGDVSGDGINDLVVAIAGVNNVGIRLGTPLGDFAPSFFLPLTSGTGGTYRMDLGEFNGDGLIDYAGAAGQTLAIGLGGVNATMGVVTTNVLPTGNDVRRVEAGDLTGDGRSDLLYSGVFVFSSPVHAYLCDGAGGFTGNPVQLLASLNSQAPTAIADVNFDGFGDVLYSPVSGPDVTCLLNTGTGTFASGISFAMAGSVAKTAMRPRDVNGDGRVDIVIAYKGTDVEILTNTTPYNTGIEPFGLGTPGCHGVHGANTTRPPSIGASGYEYLFTNTPPNALGLALCTDLAGSGLDPFGLGIEMLVGFFGATEVTAHDTHSDVLGNSIAPFVIPNNPFLIGKVFWLQGIFLSQPGCYPSWLGLSSSRGLKITIQP